MADDLDFAALESLFEAFSRSPVRTLHLRSADIELHLAKDAAAPSRVGTARIRTWDQRAAPAPASIPAARVEAAAPSAVPPDAVIVSAPNIGTFYRAPKPGAAAYVEVGDSVTEGNEICLIEVMKLFTALKCPTTGRVHSVLAEDGTMVEAGQPLFAIVTA